MASAAETYCYDGEKPFNLVKWKVKIGSQLFYNSTILSYKQDESSSNDGKEPLLKYKSNIGGTVLELLASEGDIVHSKKELLKVQPCSHPVIMKDLCAECGQDLRHLEYDKFKKLTSATTFSMVHIVPELKVSLEQAEKLGKDDENRLLKNKKLVLLVDLDQTLIHSTNFNVPGDMPDVHHFQLNGSHTPWYHTKLRPGTIGFLEKVSKFYELHICTFGARLYAHKIAQILDPNGKFFSHRILSRDECFDATSKTGNLKGLFPRGDDMVCIIDDREDVWNFAPNLIRVKPYNYFRNTGDINAPSIKPMMSIQPIVKIPEQKIVSPKPLEAANTDTKNHSPGNIIDVTEKDKVDVVNSKSSILNEKDKGEIKENNVTDKKEESAPVKPSGVETSCQKSEVKATPLHPVNLSEFCYDVDNSDDYLLYLEEILMKLHKEYYKLLTEMKQKSIPGIPDLKQVVPEVRHTVLKGVNLAFSGVIPMNSVPETHYLWTMAESLGACVCKDLVLEDSKERTTHVVALKVGTAKVNAAQRVKGVHVVHLDWLLCCAERWERADERLFLVEKDAGLMPLKANSKRPRGSQKKSADEKFSEMIFVQAGLSLSQEDINDMDKEIDEACSNDSGDDDEQDDDDVSSSSSDDDESLSSADYPKGWKKKRRKCGDEDSEVVAEESSDADTIGSVDEEMAEAVKHQFGN